MNRKGKMTRVNIFLAYALVGGLPARRASARRTYAKSQKGTAENGLVPVGWLWY